MKRHAVIVILKAEYSDLEISPFLYVAGSFVVIVSKELEAADGNFTAVTKGKTPTKCPDTIGTRRRVRKVDKIIDMHSIKVN